MNKVKNLGRRIRRLFRKSQFSKFQKFSLICFVGNSQNPPTNKNKANPTSFDPKDVGTLFRSFVGAAIYYLNQLIHWFSRTVPQLANTITLWLKAYMPNQYILFTIAVSLALLVFSKHAISFRRWVKSFFKQLRWAQLGIFWSIFLLFYLLLMGVTDLPRIPLLEIIQYLITLFRSVISKLWKHSPESGSKKPVSNPHHESGTSTSTSYLVLFVIYSIFLRYLYKCLQYKMVEDIPYGRYLIEIYNNEEKEKRMRRICSSIV